MVQSKKVITLIVLSLGIHCLDAESRWTAIRGDGYELMTDAGASDAAKMAHRVVQMRQLLGGSTKVLPLRIVLVGTESLFGALRPSATVGGFYQSSADEDWIVVRWGRGDSERAMSHEMVHAFLEHSGPRRPLWLEEGLAEFYSTAALDARGWTIGRPIDVHVRNLNQKAWLGEREFFEAAPDSAMREEGSRIGRFYAQSWAVVHYLLTAPGVREKSADLFARMGDGVPFARACEAVLGMRQGLLLEAARRAVERGQFRTARLAAEAGGRVPAAVELSGEEAGEFLVRLALAAGRPEVAAQYARQPAQRGMLALGAGRREEALRLLEEAVRTGSTDPAPYFELAMLLRESGGDQDRVAALLRSAIERNPNHAEAHFLLGLRAAARGDNEGAIDYYQRAAQILPRQATFWHSLALALERTGRAAEASHAAMRCRLAARNAAERQMAAGIERLVREPGVPAAAARKPEVQVPQSWQGLRGNASAEGELVAFDCGATPPTARVRAAGETLALRVVRPNSIRITGTGGVQHTLACGEQKTAVRVEYSRESMELTAIEFR